jgi:hypothetical protein
MQNTKLGQILRLIKRSGVCLQEYRGMHAKLMDDGLNFRNSRGYLTKLPHKWVSADPDRTIVNERPRLDSTVSVRGRASAADRRARGVSDLGLRRTDRSGPAVELERGRGSERLDIIGPLRLGCVK